MYRVVCLPSTLFISRTCKFLQSNRALGTGIEIRSRRFIATPERFSGLGFPFRFSFHRFNPISHNAKACNAVVLPELLGPMNTTGFPSSISTSPKFLKLRQINFVSILLQNQHILKFRHFHVQRNGM